MRGDHPYRRPAQKRPASDVAAALWSLACIAMVAVGACVALYGCVDLVHGGGEPARVIALAGLALLMGGTGGGVLLAGGRR